MLLALRIARRAATEIERAELWWRENRLAAPEALREDIQGAFSLLRRQPGVGTRVGSTEFGGAPLAPRSHQLLRVLPNPGWRARRSLFVAFE